MTTQSRIILHVGAGKCGSTALQKALSGRPEFTSASGQRYAYVVLNSHSGLLMGDKLVQRARALPVGALSTPNVRDSAALHEHLSPHVPALRKLIDDGVVPILSSEGWCARAEVFAETGFVEQLGGGARAVLYVRPPVDWLNSAWWQWGTWTKASLDRYIANILPSLRWHRSARSWAELPGVADVTVGLATRDVTKQFFSNLDAPAPPPVQANSGVPASFLLFLKRNRIYRPDAHSPRTEFIVANHLPKQRYPTPWVLSPEQVARIFDKLGPMTERLRRRLGPEDQAEFDADPRWHSADAYADRQVDDLARFETPEALAELIGQLRAGLGGDAGKAKADAMRQIAAAPPEARLTAADTLIAAAVDEMTERLHSKTPRALRQQRLQQG